MSYSLARVGFNRVQEAPVLLFGTDEADPVQSGVVRPVLVRLHLRKQRAVHRPALLKSPAYLVRLKRRVYSGLSNLTLHFPPSSPLKHFTLRLKPTAKKRSGHISGQVQVPNCSPLLTVSRDLYSLPLKEAPARCRNTFSSSHSPPDNAASTAEKKKRRLAMFTAETLGTQVARGWALEALIASRGKRPPGYQVESFTERRGTEQMALYNAELLFIFFNEVHIDVVLLVIAFIFCLTANSKPNNKDSTFLPPKKTNGSHRIKLNGNRTSCSCSRQVL